ncbi:hypothetical protein FB451DRAFT_1325534 [Mycena latifolia]|nr:hypothetical protein FB451DRAFT_1325534 [Mycena latifolia]
MPCSLMNTKTNTKTRWRSPRTQQRPCAPRARMSPSRRRSRRRGARLPIRILTLILILMHTHTNSAEGGGRADSDSFSLCASDADSSCAGSLSRFRACASCADARPVTHAFDFRFSLSIDTASSRYLVYFLLCLVTACHLVPRNSCILTYLPVPL